MNILRTHPARNPCPAAAVPLESRATRAWLRAALAACLLSAAGLHPTVHGSSTALALAAPAVDTKLVRLGHGTARYARIIPVYDAVLYIESGADPEDILDRDVAKRLEIVYRTSVKASQMITAAERILARQHSEEVLARWRNQIDALHAGYRDARRGDRYALAFRPGDGLLLELDGRAVTRIAAAEFAKLYFGIWFAHEPLSESLKQALISGDVGAP